MFYNTKAFKITYDVTNGDSISFTISNGHTIIYRGDGTTTSGRNETLSHTYTADATVDIAIRGRCNKIELGNKTINKIDNMGNLILKDCSFMFDHCNNFDYNANDGYWSKRVTSIYRMFFYSSFNQDIGNWNVSKVNDMSDMFAYNSNFNQYIGNWDVGNVTNMYRMFANSSSFNQDIGNWNVSNVTNMEYMFDATLSNSNFNQYIGNWDVGNVTTVERMFSHNDSFNQDIGNWNVGNVTNMNYMFDFSIFNQDISGRNVSSVTSCTNFRYNSALTCANTPALPSSCTGC